MHAVNLQAGIDKTTLQRSENTDSRHIYLG
jgi:hypothetical protein